MPENQAQTVHSTALPKEALGACRDFLRLLDQTSKLVGLYKAHHPVPTSSLQEAHDAMGKILLHPNTPRVSVALAEGHWVINALVVEGPDAYAQLKTAFRAAQIQSLCFMPGIRLYELAALCELAALPPNKATGVDATEFFNQRGVRAILANQAHFTRTPKTPPPGPVPAPKPPAAASPIPDRRSLPRTAATSAHRLSGLPFGSFIKSIVDQSVQDPEERALIYAQALRTVKDALARRVEAATVELRAEKQVAVNEKTRTSQVLGNLAQGRVTVDKDGRVLMMDPAAEAIMGKKLSEVAGKSITEKGVTGQNILNMAWETEIPGDRAISEAMRVAADPEVLDAFRKSMAVVQDQEGRVVGTYGVLPHVSKFREAERVQEEFISHVTHELRAPLAAICSALEIVSEKSAQKLSPEEQRFIQISLKNTRNLRTMVGEILDFSKIKAGKFSVHPVPTSVPGILREAVEGLRPWALSKKIMLSYDVPPAAPGRELKALADHHRVVQILTNLVSNAIKCTPAGGSIRLAAMPGTGVYSNFVVFGVRDSGCGIAPENQKKIFDRFAQVPKDGKAEGVGLGLAIVQELVTLHRGSIWLESALGQGSTFYFTLPLALSETG